MVDARAVLLKMIAKKKGIGDILAEENHAKKGAKFKLLLVQED